MTTPIAIVGIGCRLPGGADTPERFWDLLRQGVDAITEVPPDRFDLGEVYDADPQAPGKIYTRWGGFVDQIDRFDADFFGIAPREARRMDPQHRLLLEVVWEALEDGGQVPEQLGGTSTGVFIGISTHDYGDLHIAPGRRPELDAHANIGNALCAAPNRLSYLFDLRGPSMAIETACSSSLTAVHLACRSLESGESTLAIAGGVNVVLNPELTIGFCKATMMSPDGRCHAFDARANGYVRGEGAGAVILKPLAQALEDHDPIHAVIRGTAVNEDGRTPGISLPSGDAHEALLRQALQQADVAPSALQYIEAHGTGTVVGDPVEAGALGRVLGQGRGPGEELLIGSVKTNVGHLEAGAGIAGLIKTALMLRHRKVAPSLHYRDPNPAIPFGELGVRVPTQLEPWPSTDGPAMAGANSFGFGGANAHVILEEAPVRESATFENGSPLAQVLLLSAATEAGLEDVVERYRSHLAVATAGIYDVCHTAAVRRSHHEHRLAVVGTTAGELIAGLDGFLAGERSAGVTTGRRSRGPQPKLAFVFAGMGPQWWGMGQQLLAAQPRFRATLEHYDELLAPLTRWSLVDELEADETHSRIGDTRVAQVANCAVQLALGDLWRSWGVVPDAVVGHSAGELAAAHLAGALDLADTLTTAHHRGRLLDRATGTGTMLAAGISAEEAGEFVARSAGRVALAAVNGPTAVTLSGEVDALEAIAASLEEEDRFWRILPVEVPYHGPQMEALRGDLLEALAGLDPTPSTTPLASGVTGTWLGDQLMDRGHWWRSIREPVLFAAALEALVSDGVELFLEIGPHPALAPYVAESLAQHDASGAILPSLRRHEDERGTMLRSLAELHVRGRQIDWSAVYPDGVCVPLPTYPWQRERHWLEPLKATAMHGAGVDTGHPLLGRRLPTAHPAWEADLDDPRSDYLDAHVVEDSAVFPGAAYVDMALAAARELRGDTAVELQAVEFSRLLFLSRPRDRRLQVLSHPRDASLEILSAPLDAPDWTLHASATIRPNTGQATVDTLDLEDVRGRCIETAPSAQYYAALQAYGFSYGSPFRGLEQIWTGEGEALARVCFPADVELPVAAHEVHPALLDAGLQLLVAAAGLPTPDGGGTTSSLFPVSIRRVVLHRRPGERFWAHVRVHDADGAGIEGDLILVNDAGEVALACEGLRYRELDQSSGGEHDGIDDWIYELAWERADLDANANREPVALRPAHDVREELEAGDGPEQDPGVITFHAAVAPALDRVAAGFAAVALRELGGETWDSGEARADVDDVAAALGVVPRYRRLLGSLLETVDAYAADETLPIDRRLLHAELDALAVQHPSFDAEVELLRTGGEQLTAMLRGDVDAREILLGDRTLQTISRLYHASPGTRSYHDLLGDAVATALGDAGAQAPVLLEVGAGTGAATAAILPRLPDSAEYVFTDISSHFLRSARERFGGRPGMRFEVLDLEADPEPQGFEPQSVDVVVAANVLHTTADLRVTLGHVERLLAPGGLLVVLELARSSAWFDLVFGLLDGWWRFRDTDVRAASPLLDGDGWLGLLAACGFQSTAIPFASHDGHALQTMLLSHTSTAATPDETVVRPATGGTRAWLLFADEGGVADRLAETFAALGDDCRLVRCGDTYRHRDDGSVEIPADDPGAVERLFLDMERAGEGCDGVVHLWSLDIPTPDVMDGEALLESQRLGCGSALAVVQGAERARGELPDLWLVTAGSQPVEGHDAAPHVGQAPLWGLGRVLMNEQAAPCRLVDLGPSCPPEDVSALAAEVRGDGDDEELAFRGPERHVRRLRRTVRDDGHRSTATRSMSADAGSFRLESDADGTLESLVLREADRAEPGPGEVAIRVRASGLTFRDVLKALGMLPEASLGPDPAPRALGIECSGVVVACGEDVDDFRPGDEVVALGWAAHGSRVVVRAGLAAPKPSNMTFAEAASQANAFVTADYALNEVARIRQGERVLVHSAAGAVGLAAIQVCQGAGAEVFATAGTPEKRAHLAELGVEHVMDSRSLDFVHEVRRRTRGEGVDVVLNSLGGELLRASLDLLRPYGRFVELGKRDIYDDAQIGLLPFQRNLSFTAIDLIQLALDRPEHAQRLLVQALRSIEDGTYQPVPCTTFDLGDAEQAFRFMARARHIGKVVLTVEEPHYEVASAVEGNRLRDDATYLVTGGLGGFGLAVARWLVDRGARSLVLMSRSGTPKDGDRALNELRSSPATVHVVQGDAAIEEDMASVLAQIRRDLPPLRGVVHAAMVLDDDVVTRLDPARFRTVLAPKVAGAWNLHRLTADDPIDFFVLFSSIASVVGHPMQASYAAANAYLDSLAAYRRSHGASALTIGWGAVADVGYVFRHPEIAQYLDRGGFLGFSPPQALDTLGALLRLGRPHVIAARIDWPKLMGSNPVLAASRRFLPFTTEAEIDESGASPDQAREADPLSRLRNAPPEARLGVLQDHLVDKVARVLGGSTQKIDPERPLTEMGFDSLMAVELTTAIRTDLSVRLPAVKILQGGTCQELATTILADLFDDGSIGDGSAAADSDDDEEAPAPTRSPAASDDAGSPTDTYPLSFEQARLWFVQRLDPDDPTYNVPSAAGLSGPLDVGALERSLNTVVERHEVLRAAVHDVDGEPVQVFSAPAPLVLPVVDLSGLSETERMTELHRQMTAATRRPFDLTTGPLLRARLFRLAEDEHVVLLVVHHIACDAWSLNWMAREMAALYGAYSTGKAADLPPPPFRYVDYVQRERERFDDDLVSTQLDYWTRQLADAPTDLRLPGTGRITGDGHRPEHRGAHQPFALSEALTQELEAISRSEGVTLFMTLLAAFQTLLGRSAGADDICVGTPVATRSEPGAEAVVGCFMNTLVLRSDLSGDPTFRELLGQVRETTLGAFEHQDVPFEQVVEALSPHRDVGRNPLFQAMLVLHNARLPEFEVEGLTLRAVDVESGTAVTDLALLLDVGTKLRGTLEYRADRVDTATAQSLLEQYRTLLEGVVADPDRPLSALPLLTAAERHTLLVDFNATGEARDDGGCLHHRFEAQVDRNPQATALVTAHERLSYEELDHRANQLAHHLRRLGVGPDVVVGVHMDRSADAVACAMAVLKAGGAYLPLDPMQPEARLRLMLDDASVAVLLNQQGLHVGPQHRATVVTVDAEWECIAAESGDRLDGGAEPDNLAYVIYTSGSTGEPKGVLVEHRAIGHQLDWRQDAFPLSDADAVLQSTPLGFDPSVWELFGPLATGARVVIPPTGSESDTAALASALVEQQITVLQVIPSVLQALLDEPEFARCRFLEHVFCGGEPLPPELSDRFASVLPAQLHNMYGPTEAAIDATHWTRQGGTDSLTVPIGRPVAHASVYILDDHSELVPVGVPGQLHIGGLGLARGYLGQPDLTRERFVPDPFGDTCDARMYRTGDFGRWRHDGTIEFLGRCDRQIKVRGARVEPAEIEAVLVRHPVVRAAAVVARRSASGDRSLSAFVAADGDQVPTPEALRAFLSGQLPSYMVPSAITISSRLPRSPNGKVAVDHLADPTPAVDESHAHVAPRDPVETKLVRIWERFVPHRPFGVTDDFFEVGGHSLLAMRVMAHIHKEFDTDLPVSSLLEGRTVEQLARHLLAHREAPGSVVTLQPRGSGRPMFLVHPVSGTVFCYAELARALGEDRPLYGLQAAGLHAGKQPHTRVEDMARHHLEAVRRIQPTGPYVLGGWSMGGVIAHEMAGQLDAQGERVALLALFDARVGVPDDPGRGNDQALLRSFMQDLGVAPHGLSVSPDVFWRLSAEEQLAAVRDQVRAGDLVAGDVEPEVLDRQLRVFTTNLRAMRDHIPSRYSGDLTLFEAAEPVASEQDPPWDELALGGVVRHTVAGDHYAMLRQPVVGSLAERLSPYLEQVDLVVP